MKNTNTDTGNDVECWTTLGVGALAVVEKLRIIEKPNERATGEDERKGTKAGGGNREPTAIDMPRGKIADPHYEREDHRESYPGHVIFLFMRRSR